MSAALYRQSVDAFDRRDWDAFVALMDDSIDCQSRLAQMEGAYRGHEGIRRWWNDLLGAIPDYKVEVDEVREIDSFTLARGRGLASETPLIDAIWIPAEWRDGKCMWWAVCVSEEEALAGIAARRESAAG